MSHFDLFIIGAGTSAQRLAIRCAEAGLSIGITEHQGYGGTCTLRGCNPKRIMVTAAEVFDQFQQLNGEVIQSGSSRLLWPQIRRRVEDFLEPLPEKEKKALQEAGITTFESKASFIDVHHLRLEGIEESISANQIVIATGQRPVDLEIPGAAFAKTSHDFQQLEQLPGELLIIGGGYIGMEYAFLAARCGSKVHVIERSGALEFFEPGHVERLLEAAHDLPLTVYQNTELQSIEAQQDGGFAVKARASDGKSLTLQVEAVFNTAGRVANVESLNLEAIGLKVAPKGIDVDEHLRIKGFENLYAIGDVASTEGKPLTPVARLEAEALALTLTGKSGGKPNYQGVPTAVYTLPEMASVGMTEAEARSKGHDIAVTQKVDASDHMNAYRMNARHYAYKTIVDRKSQKLLGAHLIGPRASEMINFFALAIRMDMDIAHLKDMPWTYPTWTSDIPSMLPD